MVIAFFVRNNNKDKPFYKYYYWNLYAKIGFAVLYGLFYLVIYQGGDTIAYYDGSVTLNNLFLKSPELYFNELFNPPNTATITQYFDLQTGFPPGWIYREPEAWFVSKLMSLISFFTLNSYMAMTLIMAFITSIATWRLFLFIRHYGFNQDKWLAIAILLLPSVNFWCSGVSKDTLVYVAICFLVINTFSLLSNEKRRTLINLLGIIISGFVIYHIRSFILIAVLIPFGFALMTRVVKFFGGGNITVILVRTTFLIGGFILLGRSLLIQTEEEFLSSNTFVQEAAIIQDDFEKNELYGDKKYNLDVSFTPVGLIKAAPLTIITGIYRPFFWEALNPSLIFNGIESLLFIYFTFIFFRRNFLKRVNMIRTNEFLIFCLIFTLIIAFMTGLTSILFGVLVRLRAPLLPFFLIMMSIDINKQENGADLLDF